MNCQEILSMLISYRARIVELFGVDEKDLTISSEYYFISVAGPEIQISFKYKQADSKQLPWGDDILKQIDAADNIAGLALNCTKGDEYWPGNFSKVILAANHIELQQVNYMNARSSDHKDDYSLRSLVFRIPLSGDEKMITEFTDRSSLNNRQCGERIKAAIDWSPH
jgi:hypothetical protein